MQTGIRDCAEEQLTDGYKKNFKEQEKFQRLPNTEASINQNKRSHTDFKQRLVRGDRKKTHSSLGLPNGVTSSVVQDYTLNNHRSGVTNILNQLADN